MVAAELQWSEPFARGVLRRWKSGEWYCRACLVHLTRIAIDGSSTDETVDDDARASARQQIERLEAKRNAREPTPAPEAPAAPEQLVTPEKPALRQPDEVLPPHNRDGFAALRQAHRNRTAIASPYRSPPAPVLDHAGRPAKAAGGALCAATRPPRGTP